MQANPQDLHYPEPGLCLQILAKFGSVLAPHYNNIEDIKEWRVHQAFSKGKPCLQLSHQKQNNGNDMKKQEDGGSEYPSGIGRDNKRASKIRRTHSQSTQEPIYSSIMQRSLVRQIMFRVCGSNVDFSGFDSSHRDGEREIIVAARKIPIVSRSGSRLARQAS